MPQPVLFTISFIALFSFLTLIRLYYKIKANVFREPLFSREERAVFIAARAVMGVPLLLATFVHIIAPAKMAWAQFPLPSWLRILGTLSGQGALLFLIWVHRALGKNFSTSIRVKQNHALVTRGPYRIVRHPMYSAYFLIFLSAFLISGNWVIGASGLAIILLLMTARLRLEEDLLVVRFGAAYLRYRDDTPKFFPRPKSIKPARTASIKSW